MELLSAGQIWDFFRTTSTFRAGWSNCVGHWKVWCWVIISLHQINTGANYFLHFTVSYSSPEYCHRQQNVQKEQKKFTKFIKSIHIIRKKFNMVELNEKISFYNNFLRIKISSLFSFLHYIINIKTQHWFGSATIYIKSTEITSNVSLIFIVLLQ